jgi:hypothetical protein
MVELCNFGLPLPKTMFMEQLLIQPKDFCGGDNNLQKYCKIDNMKHL